MANRFTSASPRTETIRFRVSPAELSMLQKLAKGAKITPSHLVRIALKDAGYLPEDSDPAKT
jgi:hypothetical protein